MSSEPPSARTRHSIQQVVNEHFRVFTRKRTEDRSSTDWLATGVGSLCVTTDTREKSVWMSLISQNTIPVLETWILRPHYTLRSTWLAPAVWASNPATGEVEAGKHKFGVQREPGPLTETGSKQKVKAGLGIQFKGDFLGCTMPLAQWPAL